MPAVKTAALESPVSDGQICRIPSEVESEKPYFPIPDPKPRAVRETRKPLL